MPKPNIAVSVTCVILCAVLVEIFITKSKHPYDGLSLEQIVNRFGYPLETHEVLTDDGYYLTLHRIPYGKQNSKHRIPVLFMHGFSQSAADFLIRGPKDSLSFLLADKGYDVWLGNARGTTWSRKHKFLNYTEDKQFWDYSLHEIGYYDAAAFIDYILETTQQESLHYIGYSQGTSVFFMLGAEKPQYMKKIRLMTALAPAIFLKDPKGPFYRLVKNFYREIEYLFDFFRIRYFLSEQGLISLYLKGICDENSIFVHMCLHHIFLLHGYNYEEFNKTQLAITFANTPAGVSPKQFLHIAQLMYFGEFVKYDLGYSENLVRYGQEEPPRYDLSKVIAPVALYYSENDWTINTENIDRIEQILPNISKRYKVSSPNFNHNDFIFAKNVVKLLYNDVIEEIIKH